jgi:hypothetical protein
VRTKGLRHCCRIFNLSTIAVSTALASGTTGAAVSSRAPFPGDTELVQNAFPPLLRPLQKKRSARTPVFAIFSSAA